MKWILALIVVASIAKVAHKIIINMRATDKAVEHMNMEYEMYKNRENIDG
jgi:hypothetical protein